MFVNKEMFSIQSSTNFAHADQVAPYLDPTACLQAQSSLGRFFHVLG